MTKEHPQKDNMSDELYQLINSVNGNSYLGKEIEQELCNAVIKQYIRPTPPKPDVIDYGLDYSYATYWYSSLIASREGFDERAIRMVKRTINGETGELTIEVLK